MLFSPTTAEAQGSHSGYTYTQRVCQEYGQQPRRYNVRDEIAGSDWRSHGGWAIVLVITGHYSPARYQRDDSGRWLGDGTDFVHDTSPTYALSGGLNPKYELNSGPSGQFKRIRNTDPQTNTDSDFIRILQSNRCHYFPEATTAAATSAGPICSGAANHRRAAATAIAAQARLPHAARIRPSSPAASKAVKG